jgi:hypothetical protein
MATIGRTTAGASVISIKNRIAGRLATFTAGDEITSVSAYSEVTKVNKNIYASLYNAAKGVRLALGTGQSDVTGAAGWIDIPISYPVDEVTDIVIAVVSEGGTDLHSLYYDVSSPVTAYHDAGSNHAYPGPTTWSAGWGTDLDYDLSVYATYTPAGGGGATAAIAAYYNMLRNS